jgi:hypothetical protein
MHLEVGRAYEDADDLATATLQYEKALAIEPGLEDARIALRRAHRASTPERAE